MISIWPLPKMIPAHRPFPGSQHLRNDTKHHLSEHSNANDTKLKHRKSKKIATFTTKALSKRKWNGQFPSNQHRNASPFIHRIPLNLNSITIFHTKNFNWLQKHEHVVVTLNGGSRSDDDWPPSGRNSLRETSFILCFFALVSFRFLFIRR